MVELRDWVTDRFGGTGESLLDESVYSDKALRKDVIKLEHELKKLEGEMDKHGRQYKELLREGAEASEMQRKKYAQKAKFEKKKYAIKKKKYRAASVKLGTVLSIQGMREIMELQDDQGQDLALDQVMNDADAQEIQGQIMERMATFGVEMEDLQEIQNALDIPIMEDELEMDTGEEEQIMEEMAASEISEEQVDIDADVQVEADLGGEVDLDELDDSELSI
ncbi:MAG: hypothetical protein ABEI96_07035 [Haloarculaceae archaeon]